MSVSLLPPDLRRIFTDLQRRIGILERRVTPPVAVAAAEEGHTHDGTGTNSTAVAGASVATPPIASATGATAVGNDAEASDQYGTALGTETNASSSEGTAVGRHAEASSAATVALGSWSEASGLYSVAVGFQANAEGANGSLALGFNSHVPLTHDSAVAIGAGAVTTNAYQLNTGQLAPFLGAPTTVPADAELVGQQFTVYLDEGADTLVLKVKYSDGSTVKVGTVALS